MRAIHAVAILVALMVMPGTVHPSDRCGLQEQNWINAEDLFWDSVDYYNSVLANGGEPLDHDC